MRKANTLLTALSLFLLMPPISLQTAQADGFIIIDRPVHIPKHIRPPHPHPPHPWPRPPRPINRFLPLEVREHHVNVSINGQVATTSIDQVFFNPSDQRLEGTYIFPIPEGAQIDKFQMDVNGEMTAAELLDAKKARSIYEEIVRKAKDPALMEYSNQGMFKVRIFPIEPRKEKRIKIKYTQLLKRDGRITEYIYPLNTEKFSSRLIKSVSIKVNIDSKDELKSIYSPSHEIETSRKGKNRAVVGFEEKNTLPDTDFKLFFSSGTETDKPVGLELFAYRSKGKKHGKEGYYMMLLSPGAWQDEAVVAKDVVFAVDTSGSMRVKKLEQAKAALEFCLGNLNKGDRFEIVRYSTEAESLFGELASADKENIHEAREFISGLKAGGGTAIEEALIMAVNRAKERRKKGAASRPFQVIFLTDGRPTIGETRPDKILERLASATEKTSGLVRIFSFGIGTDINTKLLDRIAEDTRAITEYVLPEEDIEHKVSRFYSKISQPVMADIKIKTQGGIRLSKRHPAQLPDLFKGDQLVVFGRYSSKKSDKEKPQVILEGTLAGKTTTFSYKAAFGANEKHDFIPRLWATRRVGYLLDEIRLHGENDELKDEVVTLARRWGIVTPYTSYLIIEDEENRAVPLARQSMGQRSARPNSSPSSIINGRNSFLERFGSGQTAGRDAARYLREFEKKAFHGFAASETGDAAVAAARSSAKLKAASSTNASKEAYEESLYGNQIRFEQQSTRQIAGKTFYHNNNAWVDAEAAEKPEAKVRKIVFGSDNYFKLLARSATIAKWLSVAGNLQVLIDGEIYEITKKEES